MHFGGVVAVEQGDFAVAEGELRCLIGPNGAGKSTFFKCLTGQLGRPPGASSGATRDVTGLDPHAIARLGVGIKTQVPVAVRRPDRARKRRARAAPPLAPRPHRAGARRRGAGAARHRRARRRGGSGQLAHGQRQLVELAMVVAPEPDLIILDEPTAGMSAEETARAADLIARAQPQPRIVVVEHDMQFIRAIARTVTVFHQGRVLLEDAAERVFADPRVRDVYLGREIAA